MSNANAKAFEDKLLTIDLVDGLRREQERLDAALSNGTQLQVLRTEIQTYYAQAGITVSNELIDKAIAERQAQRFTFKPGKLGAIGSLIAGIYIYRGRVAAGIGVVAAITLGSVLVESQIKSAQLQRELAAYRAMLQQQVDEVGAVLADTGTLPAELSAIESAQVPALNDWVLALQASYKQALLGLADSASCNKLQIPAELPLAWPGELQVKTCQAALPAIKTVSASAHQLVAEHQQLGIAVTQYGLLQQRLSANAALAGWSAIATPLAAAKSATTPGSDRHEFTGTVSKASTALEAITAVAAAYDSTSACLAGAIKQAGASDKKLLSDMLDKGTAFKKSPTTEGIAGWSQDSGQACEFFKAPMSLRVVSERGVQSGVWRYYNGNRKAKTFYLIVDALSPGGGSAEALVQSAEDQKTYSRRRFGVHVSERVFEAVKADKQDDGVLKNPDVGNKNANSFSWQLPSGFEPSFIVEW